MYTCEAMTDGKQLHQHRVLWPLLQQLVQPALQSRHWPLQYRCLLDTRLLDIHCIPCKHQRRFSHKINCSMVLDNLTGSDLVKMTS